MNKGGGKDQLKKMRPKFSKNKGAPRFLDPPLQLFCHGSSPEHHCFPGNSARDLMMICHSTIGL